MPVTRTSLPGGAVVATSKRCRASRAACAPLSWARRSTAGRQLEVSTVGSANAASSASAGWIDMSSAMVTTSRTIQPAVEKTDRYMWSRTKIWSRSTASRSRWSGRSWCAMVATEACSRATCASSAIVTLSRKRRCTRVETMLRNQVAVAESARPSAAARTSVERCSSRPSPRSLTHSASSASGTAAISASEKAASMSPGSRR